MSNAVRFLDSNNQHSKNKEKTKEKYLEEENSQNK
jgi:hypothetical protein